MGICATPKAGGGPMRPNTEGTCRGLVLSGAQWVSSEKESLE